MGNDVVIHHQTPNIYNYTCDVENQLLYIIRQNEITVMTNLSVINNNLYSEQIEFTIPIGYITEVTKRLKTKEFYISARKKRDIENRIVRHAVVFILINLLSVNRWQNDNSLDYMTFSEWDTFYRQDKHKGYRTMSKPLLDTIINDRGHKKQLLEVLTEPFIQIPYNDQFMPSHDTYDTNRVYRDNNNNLVSTIGGGDREYPPIVQMYRDESNDRASNEFRLNPYFMRQKRVHANVLSRVDFKHIADQKKYVIKQYGLGRSVNEIEARNMEKLILPNDVDVFQRIRDMEGTPYRGKEIDSDGVEEMIKNYNYAIVDLKKGKFSSYRKAENRHYTPLQRMVKCAREEIAALNNRCELDYNSMHPNLIFSLLLRTLNTEWFKQNGLDIDWLYDKKFVSELSEESERWLQAMSGNVKKNLSIYYKDGKIRTAEDICKSENLSFYNDENENHIRYRLYWVYNDYAPEVVEFLEAIKFKSHKNMSNLLLKMESTIMDYVIKECDRQDIAVNGIHDAVMIPVMNKVEVKDIMNDLSVRIGLNSEAR